MGKSTTSFTKGKTGNPRGRPPGLTDRAKFRALVKPAIPGMVETLVQSAQSGDLQAIKICLDRTIPTLRPTSDALTLKTGGTLAEQGEAILKAMTSGQATPDQALVAMNALAAQAKLIEQSEVLERLKALEKLLCPPSTK